MATTMSRSGVERYAAEAKEALARRAAHRARVRLLKFDTIAVHGMYSVEEAFSGGQGGIIEPIFPSTSQAYRDSDEMEAALLACGKGFCRRDLGPGGESVPAA